MELFNSLILYFSLGRGSNRPVGLSIEDPGSNYDPPLISTHKCEMKTGNVIGIPDKMLRGGGNGDRETMNRGVTCSGQASGLWGEVIVKILVISLNRNRDDKRQCELLGPLDSAISWLLAYLPPQKR